MIKKYQSFQLKIIFPQNVFLVGVGHLKNFVNFNIILTSFKMFWFKRKITGNKQILKNRKNIVVMAFKNILIDIKIKKKIFKAVLLSNLKKMFKLI